MIKGVSGAPARQEGNPGYFGESCGCSGGVPGCSGPVKVFTDTPSAMLFLTDTWLSLH